jgi:peptide/nickel transport system ATP-binding protein
MGRLSQVQLEQKSDSQDKDVLLDVKDLCVTFKRQTGLFGRALTDVRAVDHVSFSLGRSEILSVVGESGSGKTTLARCIARLAPVTSGSIVYDGKDITKLSRGARLLEYRRGVQVIFQDPFGTLNPRQDVFSTIALPIRQLLGVRDKEEIRKSVVQVLQETGLDPDEVSHRLPHQLSGGQRQRVNIARALAPNPKLLIADEPITMLDSEQRLNILALLQSLRAKRNLAILMITHDLASARIISQRTIIMYMGKLVEEGPTNLLLSKPHHPYVELILNAMPRLEGEGPVSVAGELKSENTAEGSAGITQGCIFRPRCKYATDVCSKVEPPLEEKVSQGHLAACHNPLNSKNAN